MYISEISGHHSATLAIEQAIKTLSPETKVLNINTFNYTNPISERFVNRLYMGIIKKTPRIWDYLYDNPRVHKKIEKIKGVIHRYNSPKLKILFDKFEPDVVACSQAFPCGMVADFKRIYNSDLPLVAVLTDYVLHSYWIYDKIDYYVTPSSEVTHRLMAKGVASQYIKPLGIPFDPKFNQPVNRQQVFKKYKLNPHLPVILIMGGGQGIGPIKTAVSALDKSKTELQKIVVAGVNKKLYRQVRRKIKHCKKKTLLLGYVDNIEELMSISSIIVTKPGGITTAEALAKALPMILIKPIPGQEESNTAYLTEKGAAIRLDNLKNLNIIVEDLLANPHKLRSLSERASQISKPNASLDIARLLLSLC
jgi:processive 1,2-diacylglycerol beta-glucosyltransferase